MADDQRESTSPLTIIFARWLALIHLFLGQTAPARGALDGFAARTVAAERFLLAMSPGIKTHQALALNG